MAKGKALDNETKERIRTLLAAGNAKEWVAKTVGVSWASVDKVSKENPDNLESLREKKKTEFINQAWEVIHLATEQVKAKLGEATAGEAARVAGIYFDKQALASGDPTQTVNANLNHTADLSNLSNEELEALEKIIAKTSND